MRTLITCILLSLSIYLVAQTTVIPISKAKKACTHVVGISSLSVYYERVLVVAKKEVPAGDPDEFWVLFPDRTEQKLDVTGHLLAYNIPAEQILFINPKDGPVVVIHHMKLCRCPSFMWGIPEAN